MTAMLTRVLVAVLVVQVPGLSGEDGSVDSLAQRAVAVLHHLPQERARHLDPLVPAQTYILCRVKRRSWRLFLADDKNARATATTIVPKGMERRDFREAEQTLGEHLGTKAVQYKWMYYLRISLSVRSYLNGI